MLISRASRRRRTLLAAAAALLVSLALSTLSAGAASADDTDGISGGPANESGPDGRTRYSYQINPGQQLNDNYVVKNTGTTAQVMTIFATDAFNTAEGAYGLLDTGATPVDSGAWVTFAGGAAQLTIPLDPGATQLVPFTLTVPADASPGDHAAGIVVSVTSTQGQILMDRRVATRLYARVLGDLQPILAVSGLSATYTQQLNPLTGGSTITYTVKNTGNVALAGTAIVGINTYFGIGVGAVVTQDLDELLPGATRTMTVPLEGIGQLGYLDAYVKLQPTVDADAISPGFLAQVARDTAFFAIPWWLLILVVVALAVWVVLWIRRVRDERAAVAWIDYTEAEARRKAAESPELSR